MERFTLPPPFGAVHIMLSSLHVMTRIDHVDTHMSIPIRIYMQGEECVAAACVTCMPCNPGYYKAAVSTEACGPCPVNTYGNDAVDQTSSGYCTQCPPGSDTGGQVARTSANACQCGDRFYLTNAGATGSALSCATCPSGAVCPGSGFCALRTPGQNCTSDSAPIPGRWVRSTSGEDAGKYRLMGCPPGHQKQTVSHDTQKCHPCLESQYIINPDHGACQKCPPGMQCRGDDVYLPVVINSTWTASDGVYKLATCPRGYSRFSIDDGAAADQQRCIPCAEGTECELEVCDSCLECAAGKYKDVAGTQACRACPQNTYNPDNNSKAFANCKACPTGADTGGLDGQTSPDACQCGERFYLAGSGAENAALTCANCPSGATCAIGFCALRTSKQTCPGSSDPIPGTWVRSTSGEDAGKYELLSCPPGHQKQTASHDTQKCHPCLESQYIINPDEDSCEKCPPGLICRGDDVVMPVVENSTWVPEDGVFKLATCPTGYSKISMTDEWGQQKCEPCTAGTECVLEVCDSCSLCKAGTYKDVAGTHSCRVCPRNTFNPNVGATAFANCQTCPSGAENGDSEGMTSLENCTCQIRTYTTTSAGTRKCEQCPKGGECVDRKLGCGLRTSPPACSIVGDWVRDVSSNRFVLVGCPIGYKLENASGHDNFECQQCPEGFYVQDSRNPRDICRKCPSSAMCTNGAPPIFQAQKVWGEIQLSGISQTGVKACKEAARQVLVSLISFQVSMTVKSVQRRTTKDQHRSSDHHATVAAGTLNLAFQIICDKFQADTLAEDLVTDKFASQFSFKTSVQLNRNISAKIEMVGVDDLMKKPKGEVWEEMNGEYHLRSCPRGYILMNTTLQLSRCKECEAGTFSVQATDGCGTFTCDNRGCSPCPTMQND